MSKDRTLPNSLEKNWGADKQDEWRVRREKAIQEAMEYYQKNSPGFDDFYNFVVGKRIEIAKSLSPELVNDISKERKLFVDQASTPLLHVGTYADFRPFLLGEFDALANSGSHEVINFNFAINTEFLVIA